ncbi:MAG: XrtA system polysaccharide chain length determinant [Stellaceae bacterium]
MESFTDLMALHLFAAWRRRWWALGIAWIVCLLGWAVVYKLPNQYEVTARLHVDTDAVLVPLLRGLAVDSAIASQAELMQRTLLSHTNLQKLVTISYPKIASGPESQQERLSQWLATAIKISSVGRDLFIVSFRDSNPKVAYDVVTAALKIFIDNQTDAAHADMESAQRFLREQIAIYETQLSEAERRRADFRTRYFDILPGEGHSPSRLDVARETLAKLKTDDADNSLRLATLKRQLAEIPQFLPGGAALNFAGGALTSLSPAQQQLFDAQKNLELLQLRLTDNHPDVIAAKRLLNLLRNSETGSAGSTPAGGAISNPVYEQVRLQIVDRETTQASTAARITTAEREADRLEKLAREEPGVEADYARLDRDYSVLQKNYNELAARLEQARIAQAASTTTDNQVHIIDPPQEPNVPVAPKRLLLISGVLIFGLATGIAAIVVFEQLDRSFGSLLRLRRLGMPVIGAISRINRGTPWDLGRRATMFVLGVGLLLIVYGGLMIRAGGISSGV